MNDPQRRFGARVADARGVAIDEGLRQYMLGVYNYMALGVAGAGVISLLVASNESLMYLIAGTPLKWALFIAVLAMGWIGPRVIFSSGSSVAAHAMFWLNAALWGAFVAPFLYFTQAAGAAQDIYRAFFLAASIFGAMSLWGYTTKRDLTSWTSILVVGGIVLLAAIVLNALFFHSTMGSLLISSAVIVYVMAVTAYETQTIKSLYREGGAMNERASIFGAFSLFTSFVVLFIHILNILGIMRD